MNEFLKMDIFFFVTTVVVVVLGAVSAYAIWRVGRVLKHIEHISEQAALESDTIRQDLAGIRSDIRQGKGRLKSLFSFFTKNSRRASKKS
ncbi:MAG: hypothetical protein WCS97_02515 [Candidatus Paceibacterota bacterium]|jgi:hypothetical protein